MKAEKFEIKVNDEAPNVKTFTFQTSSDIYPRPGQFAMIGLEDGGEKPFSFSGEKSITVKKIASGIPGVKTFTERVFELEDGGSLLVSGPRGRGFAGVCYKTLYIGGGFGLAPLKYHLEKESRKDLREIRKDYVKVFAGGKTAADVIFKERFEELSQFHIATEDGSAGYHGTAIGMLKEKKDEIDPEYACYICGPEKMMKAAAEFLVSIGIDDQKIECSLERYMKCGIGECGGCSCGGYRICVDGPVFRYTELKDIPDFGKRKRAKSGRLVDI
jgi:dihydroorotate dehydrogenase electron transfer subunit